MAPKDDKLHIVQRSFGHSEDDDDAFSLFHLDLGCPRINLKFPYSQGEYLDPPEYSELIGSDCGIVCVRFIVFESNAYRTDIYLWNPATRHSKRLPLPNMINDDYTKTVSLGFGFDHIDLDFKVVRVVSGSRSRSVEVYSSSKNNWREIHLKSTYVPPRISSEFCFKGFLIALKDRSSMLTFDLNKEVFHCGIDLPVVSKPVVSFANRSSLFGTQTCVTEFKDTIAYIISINDGKIDMWTLDDKDCLGGRGVKASWSKVHVIDLGAPLNLVQFIFSSAQFLVIEKDGRRILYDLDEIVITEFSIYPYLKSHRFFKYGKSLFHLKDLNE
ncbi:uncharacterized protein LOC108198456 [Daucus carota subsp. sativus]|uniref:uncharacterized protein LOC108198456 n=1 Tax=Daucus carota subsp. sativus TaxID=79200 RepID=UPI0007EFCCFF|nr:PREDICTED: uncharacterized protein LOC108198456 [Daucus carota subsp. sativus]